MPDTGAPYFIPYVEPTDLVRDYPAADEASADAIAAALDNIPVLPGIGSNVVQTVKTNPFSTASLSFTDVTGMSVTITPSSATSKVLVLVTATVSSTFGVGLFGAAWRIMRNGVSTPIGDANGVRTRATSATSNPDSGMSTQLAISFLDSPGTTAPQTYQLETRGLGNSTVAINRTATDANNANRSVTASFITAIEVAA